MATLVSDKIKLTNHWLRSDNEKIIDAKDIDWTGYTLGSQNIHHSSELISYINSIGAFKLNGSYVNNNDDLKVIQNICFNNNNFTNKFNRIKKEGERNKERLNPTLVDKKAFNYSNTKSKQQMADKSFAMLQDRYNNGLISLEEFTRKCNNLEKQRRN